MTTRASAPGERGEEPRGEVVVVLGAAVWSGGMPSPALLRRVHHGVRALREHGAEALLLTGGLGRFPPTEARVMADLARGMGVSAERILLEPCATNTRESAALCAEIIARHGFRSVLLVTDHYHLRRAELAFRRRGVAVRGLPIPDPVPGPSPRRRLSRALREWLGLAWYRIRSG